MTDEEILMWIFSHLETLRWDISKNEILIDYIDSDGYPHDLVIPLEPDMGNASDTELFAEFKKNLSTQLKSLE